MLRFFSLRAATLIFLGLLFVGCAASSVGTIVIDGVPAKIEIVENTPDGVIVKGMDININSEFIGTAKRLGHKRSGALNSQVKFAPVNSKYGEVQIVQNIRGSLAGTNINFDVYIGSVYTGNIQMSQAL